MRIDIKKLRQDRAAKATRGKAATAEFNRLGAKADRTAEEDATYTALDTELISLEADIDALDLKIEAEERTARRNAKFNAPSPIIDLRPAAGGGGRVYGEPTPGMGGFRSMSELGVAVARAATGFGMDPRLNDLNRPAMGAAPANFEQNQGGSGEGFLVPPDFREEIWRISFDPVDLLGMITPIPTNSNMITMSKDETTPWGSTGIQAVWRSEGTQMVASKISQGQTTLQLHEMYAFAIATNEILDDAPRLNDMLTMQAARAIRWKASDAIMWGDGNGKPLGFQNAGALVTVAKESGQATGTLAVNNILKMSARLLRFGGGRRLWIANSDVEPQLASLTIGNIPFFLPNNSPGMSPVFEGMIRGAPCLYSEHAAGITTQGDINLINLDGYALATKAGGGVDFAASIHLFFDYGMQAFRWTFRMGGQPYLSAPVTPANGSTTKTHFVTLATR